MDKIKDATVKNIFHNKTFKITTICIQIIILLTLFIVLQIAEAKEPASITTTVDKWSSNYISYNEGWYIDDSICQTNSTIDMIYGPYAYIPKGYYTIKIWYECNNNQSFIPYATNGNNTHIKAGTGILDNHLTYITNQIEITEDINNFEVQIKYNGKGYLKINNIEIVPNYAELKKSFIILIALFLIFDVLLFNWRWFCHQKTNIWALLGIVFLTSLPIMMQGLNAGHDLRFHMLRIEGIAKELSSGTFPVRLSSNWMAGYGYPVSIYYGDILLYFPAILRIAGFTIGESYKAYVVFINILTIFLSYISFKKIFKRTDIATLTTLAYSLSNYRMINIYIRAAVGEYSAMTFLPVIALAIFNIYNDEKHDSKHYIRNSFILALGMTGVLQTHILTTEMVVLLLLLICIIFFKKTIRPNTLKIYFLAIIETILLNLWFLVPFIDYYLNVPVAINNSVASETAKNIQQKGAYIVQYFSFLQTPYGKDSSAINERISMTPGFLLMMTLIIAIILWINKKADYKIKVLTLLSLFVLFLASNLFPWNHLATNHKAGNLLAQVQFPWRYIGISTILLALLLGFVLTIGINALGKHHSMKIYVYIAVIGAVSAFSFASSYCNGASVLNYYDSPDPELDLFASVSGGEYLRVGNSRNSATKLTKDIISENIKTLDVISRFGTNMELYCETENIDGKLILPIFNYKGYQAKDDHDYLYFITDGPNSQIALTIPPNYAGNITVSFISPWYWRCAEVISLISVLLLTATLLLKNFKLSPHTEHDK